MFAIQTGQPPGGDGSGGTGLTVEEVVDLIASTLVAGTGITIVFDDALNTITISATGGGGGLDAEAVNDLIGASIVAGSGVSVVFNDAANTITISNTAPDTGVPPTTEQIQDIMAATLVAGTNVTISYNDAANTITINATGAGGGLTAEDVQDIVGTMFVAGAGIGLNYNDAGNILTVTNTAPDTGVPPTTEQIQDIVAGLLVAGTNVTLTYDDVANTLTIAATGGGGGLDAEQVTDLIGSSVLGSASVTATFSDAANTVTLTIPARGITPALHFALNTRKVLARLTAGSGDVEQLDPEQILDMISNTHGTILFRGSAVWFGLATSTPGYVLTTQGPGQNPIWNEALASLGVAARGDIIYRGAAAWLRLAAGATGRVLTTKGPGADPSWDPPAAGGQVTIVDAEPVAVKGEEWFESDTGKMYVRYQNPDTTFTWVLTNPTPPVVDPSISNGVVFRNRFHNGNFLVDQIKESGIYLIGLGGPSTVVQTLDGITIAAIGGGGLNCLKIVDAFGVSYMQISTATVDASLAAGDQYVAIIFIEGNEIVDFKAGQFDSEYITISFDVNCTLVGTYTLMLGNGAQNRSYLTTFTVNVANVWESKKITIKLDNTGTWIYGTGIGLVIQICFGTGTTYTNATANAWIAGNFVATTGQINFMAAVNTMYIRNVQVEKGTIATPFEKLPFQVQLARCQRYYEKSFSIGQEVKQNSGVLGGAAFYRALLAGANLNSLHIPFAVEKRVNPSMTMYAPLEATANWYNGSLGAPSAPSAINISGTRNFAVQNPQVAGDGVSHGMYVHWSANCRLS